MLEASVDPLLTFDILLLLKEIGDESSVPFLKQTATKHYNSFTRKAAKKALSAVQARTKDGS